MRTVVAFLLCACLLLLPLQFTDAAVPPSRLQIHSGAMTSQKVVAITFDDGPSAYTSPVLDVLRRFRIHATFFVVGIHVRNFAESVRLAVREGNAVGNHTYEHPDLLRLEDFYILQQLRLTQEAVQTVAGVTPHWFRPPYGAIDGHVTALAAGLGLSTVTWSVDPADWARPGVAAIVGRVLWQVHPGAVILLHDGGGDRSETVAALPYIISALQHRGYRFLLLDQLLSPGANSSGNVPAASGPVAR